MPQVTKADKRREEFNEENVINSIKRAGIQEAVRGKVLQHVESKLYDGIPTSEIYHHIIEFLGESNQPYSRSKYSLKESIMSLGPTGYPFEDFVAKLLQSDGYTTKVRQILRGECITHEIDVLATKNGKTSMIEAKFHNNPGTRSQIHVGLYTQARFEDVKAHNGLSEAWLVTNTKTTIDVNTYAQCKNIKVISWSYPDGGGLRDMIEKSRLHPVTILTSLNQSQKRTLLENHIVLCKEINLNPSLLGVLNLPKQALDMVLAEVGFVCREE